MSDAKTSERELEGLDLLVGAWTIEATHPAIPGLVRGSAEIEWLEGKRFLIIRTRLDHAEFPDSISILGMMDRDRAGADAQQLCMHYYDSRGVSRVYEASVNAEAWRMWRDAPGFSQRFRGAFANGGDAIDGRWQLCEDDEHWHDDLEIVYRRRK